METYGKPQPENQTQIPRDQTCLIPVVQKSEHLLEAGGIDWCI